MPEKIPTLQFSFPCDGAREDTGGALSVDRIVDGFQVRKPDEGNPLSFVQVLIVNGWTDGEGLHADRVAISGPSGSIVGETQDHSYLLPSPMARAVNMHGIGLDVTEEGEHRIHVYRNGEEVLSYPIGIRFRERQRR
jgi:hypothetical protein